VHSEENANFVDQSMRSIWDDQHTRPDQVVIVKDGPLTPELDVLMTYWKSKLGYRLKIINILENKGLGAALNIGLISCDNELVARMDTDDIALPERFERQIEFLESNPKVDILGSFVEEMTFRGDFMGIRRSPIVHETIVANLWASPMVHPSIMMRRSRILAAGNYDPAYRRRQDYELWFRCAERGLRFHNLPQALLRYRFGLHTHKKQSKKLALEQAMVGYRGARRLGMPLYQQAACFIPFLRSLLPAPVQHMTYKLLKPFDPRQKTK